MRISFSSFLMCLALALTAGTASAQKAGSLAANQTYGFGAVILSSRVGGANTQLATIWTGTPTAPLTVTLNGSTGTISSSGL